MTSKWIEEIADLCSYNASGPDAFDSIEETLKRIDALLFRAMLSVEDTNLSDEIEEELNGTAEV